MFAGRIVNNEMIFPSMRCAADLDQMQLLGVLLMVQLLRLQRLLSLLLVLARMLLVLNLEWTMALEMGEIWNWANRSWN